MARLGIAARRRPVRDEAAEDVPVTRDEAVERVGHPPADHAVSDKRAVGTRETPAGEALVLWE
jgi:hypothetical protein